MAWIDRTLLALLVVGVWLLAFQPPVAPSHASGATLTRTQVTQAVRDALREARVITSGDIAAEVRQALSSCTLSANYVESKEGEDPTDLIGRLQC